MHLNDLVQYSREHTWDETCKWAEDNFKPISDHMSTWYTGRRMGASRDTYLGHLVKMIINLKENDDHGKG